MGSGCLASTDELHAILLLQYQPIRHTNTISTTLDDKIRSTILFCVLKQFHQSCPFGFLPSQNQSIKTFDACSFDFQQTVPPGYILTVNLESIEQNGQRCEP